MKEVDARGYACPEPVVMTMAALKGNHEDVKVLVDEAAPRFNVEKYAKSQGRKTEVREMDGYYEITISE